MWKVGMGTERQRGWGNVGILWTREYISWRIQGWGTMGLITCVRTWGQKNMSSIRTCLTGQLWVGSDKNVKLWIDLQKWKWRWVLECKGRHIHKWKWWQPNKWKRLYLHSWTYGLENIKNYWQISNHMPSLVREEITYTFLNFNGYIVEVWEWISNFKPNSVIYVIIDQWWD